MVPSCWGLQLSSRPQYADPTWESGSHPQLSPSLGTSSQKQAQAYDIRKGSCLSLSLVFASVSPAPSLLSWDPSLPPGLITVPFLPQPEDLEAPKTHHFKVKTFKKVKPCGICRQVITREGCTCKGEQLMGQGDGGMSSWE